MEEWINFVLWVRALLEIIVWPYAILATVAVYRYRYFADGRHRGFWAIILYSKKR